MKETKTLYIGSSGDNMKEVLEMTDAFIESEGLDEIPGIHLRLLVEETVGMVKVLTGNFNASLNIVEDNGEYQVRLRVKTDMDKEKKSDLLSVSTSGKNAAAKGFMGKIGEIIENGLLNFEEFMKPQPEEEDEAYTEYAYMMMGMPRELQTAGEPLMWSLSSYREALGDGQNTSEPAREAWDELEKSIVASLARDVIVGIKKDYVDMTIVAK